MAGAKKTGPSAGSRTDLGMKTRVKTAKGRKISSTLWLQRQLNDPYVKRAHADGYRSRAAYKLIEINERHKLLAPGMRVIDLGSAPGGWLQVAVREVRSKQENPLVIGIDYLDVDPVSGALVIKKDFNDPDAPAVLIEALGGHRADVVLSDMAAPTTGHRATDHLRIVALVDLAAAFATEVLAPGGSFVAKVLQGGTEHKLLAELKRSFATTFHVKPPASRSDSAESYLVAKGFRG